MKLNFYLNGEYTEANINLGDTLLKTLRALGCVSVKEGCSEGSCGTCTVWVDERPVLACMTLAVRCGDCRITTLEGVQEEALKLGEYLLREAAEQCGYCSPGLIMLVLAMKKELKNPTKEEIESYINGNLCRCSGYQSRRRALEAYLMENK